MLGNKQDRPGYLIYAQVVIKMKVDHEQTCKE